MNRHSFHHHRADVQLPPGAGDDDDVPPLGPDRIDGTQDGLLAFLAEMAQLAGDGGEVLTLLLDGIVTIGMAAPQGGLAIVAHLPRTAGCRTRTGAPPGCELAWHAETGNEVLVRQVALDALRSEPGVLDAIMDCARMARMLADET